MLERIEKKLSGVIFGIKQNTKTMTDAEPLLKLLQKANPLLVEDYQKKLATALALRKPAQA